MNALLTAKPMLDAGLATKAYCFQYRVTESEVGSLTIGTSGALSPCFEVLNKVGISGLTNEAPIFLSVSVKELSLNLTKLINTDPAYIVLCLVEIDGFNDEVCNVIMELKKKGFRFAVISSKNITPEILKLCDFWCFTFTDAAVDYSVYKAAIDKRPNKSFVAINVDDIFTFEMLKEAGFKLFIGKFSNVPILRDTTELSPLKVNQIQLMNAVMKAEDDFQFKEISDIISRDMHLTVSILKYINSPYWGIRRKVKDIHQAVVFIGVKEVKRWVSTTISTLLGQDKPDETTRTSLLRARFAENLSHHIGRGRESSELFLMGLFSTLDVVLEMSMNQALSLVSVSDEITDALISEDGPYGSVYRLILAYEYAEWDTVIELSNTLNISPDIISKAYIDSLCWYNAVTKV